MSIKNIVAALTLAFSLAAGAAEKHWLGTDATSPTLASVAANWNPSGAPTADDDVVLDAGSNNNPMTWDLDNGVKSWTQSDYTGTVTFKTGTTYGSYTCYGVSQADGSKALEISGNLTLSSGTWTHEATPAMTSMKKQALWKKGFGIYRLIVLVGGNCTIGAGASINVDGKGFGTDGPGTGNTNTGQSTGTCASHAGFGGYNYGAQTNTTYVYGSTKMPISHGSGRNSNGGGAVRLSISGTLSLDGKITSIGPSVSNYPGSGGSVWITAVSLSGAGSVSVNGGATSAGCGGGGRLAVYLTGEGEDFSSFEGKMTSYNTSNYGTCGTVYLETAADGGAGKLVLACGENASTSQHIGSKPLLCTPLKAGDTNEYVFSTVEFSNWTNLGIMPGVTVTVARVSASNVDRNFMTLYGGALKLAGDGGDFTLAGARLRTYLAESSISVGDNGAGTLNLASGAAMHLNAPTLVNGLLVATGTLRIGADVTVRDFQLPKKSTVYLNGHVLTVTNPAKRKSLSVLGTVDTGDGGEIVWPLRGLRLIFR